MTCPDPAWPVFGDFDFVVHLAVNETTMPVTVNHGGFDVALVEFLVAESLDFIGAPFLAAHPRYVPAANQPPVAASIASKLVGRRPDG